MTTRSQVLARTLAGAVVLASTIIGVLAAAGGDRIPEPLQRSLAALVDPEASDQAVLRAGRAIGVSDDDRLGWVVADRLRFTGSGEIADGLEQALARLLGPGDGPAGLPAWVRYSDLLARREVPAPPGYLELKRAVLTGFGDPGWAPFLTADADVDWRTVTSGGVGRDGIASLDDPRVLAAEDARWLSPTDVVFGVVVNGVARAYPRRVLVVHELVNDTLGGHEVAVSLCTLCGAAVPYLTDGIGDLRTSGLLQRSNKLMYDVATESLIDQLLGVGVAGPLRGMELPRLEVTVTRWSDWRELHPGTTVLAKPPVTDRNLFGDPYLGDFLGGRDAAGPIFPVGPVDDRAAALTVVLGVRTDRGVAVAFDVEQAREVLADGGRVRAGGVVVSDAGGGLQARLVDGPPLPSIEAFWFAWSQTRPDTLLWPDP